MPRSSDHDHPFLLQDLRSKLDVQAAVPVEDVGLCSAQAELVSALMSVTDETRQILAEAAASSEAQMDGLRADMLAVQVGITETALPAETRWNSYAMLILPHR